MKYKLMGHNRQADRKVKSIIGSILVHLLLFWFLSFSPNKRKHETPKTKGLRIVQIMPKAASAVASDSRKGSGKKGGKSQKKWKPKKETGEDVPNVTRRKKTQSVLRKKVASKSENAKKNIKKKTSKQSKAARKLAKSKRKKVRTKSKKTSTLAKKLTHKRKTYKERRKKARKKAAVKVSQKKLKKSKTLKTKTVKQRKISIKQKTAKVQKKAREIKASKTAPKKRVLRKKVSAKQKRKKRLVVKRKKRLHLTKTSKKHLIKKRAKRRTSKSKTSRNLSKTSKWKTRKTEKTTPVKKIQKRRMTRVLQPSLARKTVPLPDSKKPVTKRDKRPVMKKAELSVKNPYAPKHKMLKDNKAKAALKSFKEKKLTKKIARKVHRTLSKRRAKVEFKEDSVVMVRREETLLKISEPKRKFSYGNIREVSKSSFSESEEEPQENNTTKAPSKSMPEPNPDEAERELKNTSMFAPEQAVSFTPALKENKKSVAAPSASRRKKVALQDITSEETASKTLRQNTREDVSEITSIVSRKSFEVASNSEAKAVHTKTPEFEAVRNTISEKASFSSSNPDPLEDISEEVGYKSMEELVKNETALASEQEGRETSLNKYAPSSAQSQQRKADSAAADTEWSKAAPKEESLFSETPQKNSLDATIARSVSRESALSGSAVSSSSVESSDKAEAESFQWEMKNEKGEVKEVGELNASQAGETNMEYMNKKGSDSFRSLAPVSEFSSKDKKKAKVPMTVNRPSGGLASSKVFKMNGKLGDSNFVSANVFINGVAQLAMIGEDGSFTSVLPLKAGINQIQIYAVSPKGKRSEQKFQLWLPPNKYTTKNISLESPENGAIRSLHDKLLVSGSIDDKSLKVATLYINDIPRKISVVDGKFKLTVEVEGFHMCKLRVQAKTDQGEIYTSNEATVLINADPREGQAYQQPN